MFKIIEGEIQDFEYSTIFWLSLFGPIFTAFMIIIGIIYLLITIPYKIIFGRDK